MKTADVFLSAGMATSPRFMEEAGDRMASVLRERGWDARTMLLFPYGDRTRNWFMQVREIRHDMLLRPGRQARSIGGGRIAGPMRSAWRGGLFILIGHSGGGIAGLHAIQRWDDHLQEQLTGLSRIVLVGSPKSPVPRKWQPRTMHIGAWRKGAVPADPIVRLGTWGGWEQAQSGRLPRWNPLLYAPGTRQRLELIGGHPDYFRSRPPYVDGAGRSNLDKLMECILNWMNV